MYNRGTESGEYCLFLVKKQCSYNHLETSGAKGCYQLCLICKFSSRNIAISKCTRKLVRITEGFLTDFKVICKTL